MAKYRGHATSTEFLTLATSRVYDGGGQSGRHQRLGYDAASIMARDERRSLHEEDACHVAGGDVLIMLHRLGNPCTITEEQPNETKVGIQMDQAYGRGYGNE